MTDSTDSTINGLVYTAVADLQYANSDGTAINATITFTALGDLPYTLTADDTAGHGAEIYAAVLAGTYGTVAAYVAPTYTTAELEAIARVWRDAEIEDSQWIVERHRDQVAAGTTLSITADQYTELLTYRQALRDWPTVTDFPADSTKPTAPSWLAAAETAAETATTTTTDATTATSDATTTDDESSSSDSTDTDTDATATDTTTTTAS